MIVYIVILTFSFNVMRVAHNSRLRYGGMLILEEEEKKVYKWLSFIITKYMYMSEPDVLDIHIQTITINTLSN